MAGVNPNDYQSLSSDHQEAPPATCNICNEQIDVPNRRIQDYQNHILDNWESHQMRVLTVIEANVNLLREFFRLHKESRKIKCGLCDYPTHKGLDLFTGRNLLINHLVTKHDIGRPVIRSVMQNNIYYQGSGLSWQVAENQDNSVWLFVTKTSEPSALEHHSELTIRIQNEIDNSWMREFFTVDANSSEIICLIDGCIIGFHHDTDFLSDHLLNHHYIQPGKFFPSGKSKVYCPRPQISWRLANKGRNSVNLIWQYFTRIKFVIKCNVCNVEFKHLCGLQNHLKVEHQEKMKRMLKEIKKEIEPEVSPSYLTFDIQNLQIKCSECGLDIKFFKGIYSILEHVYKRNCREAITASGNVRTNVHAQQSDPSEVTKNQAKLPWGSSDNWVWLYFNPVGNRRSQCQICGKKLKGALGVQAFEKHLQSAHKQEVIIMYKGSFSSPMSKHYKFDDRNLKLTCKYCNEKINYFRGEKHVEEHIKVNHFKIYLQMQSENADMQQSTTMQQSIARESNINIDVQRPGPSSRR